MKKMLVILAVVCAAVGLMAGCSGGDKGAVGAGAETAVMENASEAGKGESVMEAGKGESAAEAGKDENVSEVGKGESVAEAGKGESAAEVGEDEGSAESGQGEVAAEEILVAAAASLKNAYEQELIPMFQERYPNLTVKGTYDSSGKLQSQIEEGLEADVFMSAARKQMKALEDEGLMDSDTVVDLLENKIVLIVPLGNEEGFSSFMDIAKAERAALGDPASVPAGQYAQEALTYLGLWEAVSEKASLGMNVTEVLNQVAEGSADAGIVYATDAASMPDKVSVVAEAPEGSLTERVVYPVGVVKNTAHQEAAERFVEFLSSPEAMKVFVSYGFSAGK